MTQEVWKTIPGFSRYEVSDRGRVRVARPDVTGRLRYIGHIVKAFASKTGYFSVLIRNDDNEPKNLLVHHAVAAAFIGPRPPSKQTNHKDGDKSHNEPGNLEYITASENFRHALAMQLAKPASGEAHWKASLTDDQVIEITRRARAGEPQKELADEFNCTQSVISRFKHGNGRAGRLNP